MIDRDIGAVVVVEETTAVGVFTERDLTRRLLDDESLLDREVGEVTSSPSRRRTRPTRWCSSSIS